MTKAAPTAPVGTRASRTYDGQPTKTGKSNRIPVHLVLAEMLTEWRSIATTP